MTNEISITERETLHKNPKNLTCDRIDVRLSSLRSQEKWFFWEIVNHMEFGLNEISMLGWTTKRKAINNFKKTATMNGWKNFKWLPTPEEIAR